MTTLPKVSNQSAGTILLDIIFIASGVIAGGLVALGALWLWFDYHTAGPQSLLGLLSTQLLAHIPANAQTTFLEQTRMMGLPLAGETPAYWYVARSGGIVAYVLLWLSVVWGLVMSTKLSRRIAPQLVYGLHEFLAISALIFIALHSLVLLGDRYFDFTIFHLAIPFTAPYEPLWTGIGTIAFYLCLALTVSFYIRKQIGHKVWRAMHTIAFLAYALVLGHGLMAGTDSDSFVMQLIYLSTGLTVLFLTYYRLFTLKAKLNKPAKRKLR